MNHQSIGIAVDDFCIASEGMHVDKPDSVHYYVWLC